MRVPSASRPGATLRSGARAAPGVRGHDRFGRRSEPSGSSAGVPMALPEASTPGPGSGWGRPERIRSRATAFWVGLGLVALDVGQHHRADRGGDQQRGGELEGEQVVGEHNVGERVDVAAVGVGASQVRPAWCR